MRNLLRLSAIALITMVFSSPGLLSAQRPSGSYRQTCRDIHVNGNTLEADCQNGNGEWNRTSLPDYGRCNGSIVNDTGNLRCGGDVNGYNGGYNNGDRDRDRDRDRDWDRDRDRQGGYQGGYYNRGNGGYYQNGAPGGSYTQTCQNIQVSGNTLRASCQKSNGHYKSSSLHNFDQCNDISNENGNLRCR